MFDKFVKLHLSISTGMWKRCDDPAIWWKHNKIRYPASSKVAQIYLAPPPNSVPSERLFSFAGDVISEHRARLHSENAEKTDIFKIQRLRQIMTEINNNVLCYAVLPLLSID